MNALHNRHQGQRAFLVGTGPSLRETDGLVQLGGEITFACSRLRFWKDCPFTPMYQVITEWSHLLQLHAGVKDFTWDGVRERFLVTPKSVMSPKGWTWIEKDQETFFTEHVGPVGLGESWDRPRNGRSVVLIALQLALWMGCDPIYVVGCETTFKGHVWNLEETWNEHGLERHLEPFRVARTAMEKAGRRLVDCTPGGNLSVHGVLEYEPLKEVLHGVLVR